MNHNLGAAVILHPAIGFAMPLEIPAFYTGGSEDIISQLSANYMYTMGAVTSPKVFAEIDGAGHVEPAKAKSRWTPYVIAFFECHLNEVGKKCDEIYGKSTENPCSLCTCKTLPLTVCKYRKGWLHLTESVFSVRMAKIVFVLLIWMLGSN
jgi:hypothetical protein